MVASAKELSLRLKDASAGVPAPVVDVLVRLQQAGFQAYLAGGCVRDVLLGRVSSDFDVASSARPEQVIALFPRVHPTGLQHGTVTVVTEGDESARHVEVTTFRGEGAYHDGRRPTAVTFLEEVEKDLARRDFTVNAIAWDPVSDIVVDPFGGVADAARRRIRAVGNPVHRFSEDGLRALRAVRFASVLSFGIDAATRQAIPETMGTFRKVAVERVRDEFIKLLVKSPKPSRGLELLADTGLLQEFLPELLEGKGVLQNRWHRWPVWEHVMRVVDHSAPRLEVRLGAVFHDIAKPRCAAPHPTNAGEFSFHRHEHVGAEMTQEILERLKFPTRTTDAVVHLVKQHNWYYSPDWSDGAVRRHLAKVGADPQSLSDFLALREADIRGHGVNLKAGLSNLAELEARFAAEKAKANALSIKELAVDGRTLMSKLSIPPGPQVGELLRALLQHVLDEPDDNTEARLLELAQALSRATSETSAGAQPPP